MIIYTVLLCVAMAGRPVDCRVNSKYTFQSLAECRQYQGMSRPIGSDGRTVLSSSNEAEMWWECASKHVDVWLRD